MVTRNIAKDTATQVNANLIGVLVNPPVETVNSIVVDFTYDTVEVSSVVDIDNVEYQLITDADNNVYRGSDDEAEYDGTSYKCWYLYDGAEDADSKLWSENGTINPSDDLFIITFADDEVVDVNAVSSVKTVFSYDGDGLITNSDGSVAGDFNRSLSVSGNYLVDPDNKKFALIVDRIHHIDNDTEFVEDGGVWVYNISVGEYEMAIDLITSSRNPSAGDEAYYFGDPDYNVQTIKSIDGDLAAVDCTLSYSVDGYIWTDWPENMTDDNNVISNIPRYMYLMFSQDVVITEE